MTENHDFLAGVLRQAPRALAGYAAQSLLEQHPDAEEGFAPDPFAGWKDWLALRVDELAAAASARRTELFVSQVQWARALLVARGIEPRGFRRGLECLRRVLAEELPEAVRPLADEYIEAALAAFDQQPSELSARLLPDTEMGRLASTYLLTLLEGDRRRAAKLLLDAVDQGSDVRDLYLDVLRPAQEELGRMWMAAEINVAEEHFASQATKAVMSQLFQRADVQPANGKTMLAASVQGNQHDIGLQAVADFFEMDGWRAILLGANVPTGDLVQAIECFKTDLLGLSISQPTQLDDLRATITAVRASTNGGQLKILVGGGGLAGIDDASQLGADGYAPDPPTAVVLGRNLVGLD